MIGSEVRVRDLLADGEARLTAAGVEQARLDAELLLACATDVPRLELRLRGELEATGAQAERFDAMIRRRARREPLQYVVGGTPFREIDLRVDARALVPRPETEVLVGVVLDRTREAGAGRERVLDIGTGTGAIALSLLAEGGFERAVATDASADALALAHENAVRLGLASRLDLRLGETWAPVAQGERFAAVVSNPPYVATSERSRLAPEVVDWEPPLALFAGADGLDVIREIVAGAAGRLLPGGLLALEIGEGQGTAVLDLMKREPDLRRPELTNDWAGRPRIVTAWRR